MSKRIADPVVRWSKEKRNKQPFETNVPIWIRPEEAVAMGMAVVTGIGGGLALCIWIFT
jgi:hypothetical protein